MVQVSGYTLRGAIKRWELRRDTAAKQFTSTLFAFEGEEKTSPDDVAKQFGDCEAAIAALQAAQSRYNLAVAVIVKTPDVSTSMTLCEAVKRLGGAGRVEKMWRVATNGVKDRYGRGDDVEMERDPERVRAHRVLPVKDTLIRATKAAAFANALRAAISEANANKVDIDLDAGLLFE